MEKPFSEDSDRIGSASDDVDFDEEQDLWEDLSFGSDGFDLYEQTKQKRDTVETPSSSKKRSYITFLASFVFTLCFFGAAAWLYYSGQMPLSLDIALADEGSDSLKHQNDSETVKTPTPAVSVGAPENSANIAKSEKLPKSVDSSAIQNAAVLNDARDKNDVLTPLPDIEELELSQLSDLNAPSDEVEGGSLPMSNENEPLIKNDMNLNKKIEEGELEEKKLLSATETLPLEEFEERLSQAPHGDDVRGNILDKKRQPVPPEESVTIQQPENSQKSGELREQSKSEGRDDERKLKIEKQSTIGAETRIAEVLSDVEEKKINKKALVKDTTVQSKNKRSVNWELRSAHFGGAMIADKSTGQIISVEKGSVVSGIGRIISVSKVDGRWVVKGTLGAVSQ